MKTVESVLLGDTLKAIVSATIQRLNATLESRMTAIENLGQRSWDQALRGWPH